MRRGRSDCARRHTCDRTCRPPKRIVVSASAAPLALTGRRQSRAATCVLGPRGASDRASAREAGQRGGSCARSESAHVFASAAAGGAAAQALPLPR
eukprot:1349978-Prymnesium_polylepis.1